jgi:prepilin-type N-terminal cleavage/methylation domain-containing protein
MSKLTVKLGFTLTELLISVAILAILVVIALSMVKTNRDKADDAKTKAELDRLRIAFEDYYSDHNCYPPAEFFDDASDCGSNNLSPYLGNLPCDRHTNLPYILETDATGCSWFKLYTSLRTSQSDPQAQALCASDGSNLGNYVVSSSNVTATVYCDVIPESSSGQPPTQLPEGHNYYYCSAVNNCTWFNHTIETCTPYYTDNPNCGGNGDTKCQSVGSCQRL